MTRLLYQDEIDFYFAPVVVMEGRQIKYRDHFVSLVDRLNKSLGKEDSSTKEELQYYKDEMILTLYTFVSIDKINCTPAGEGIWKAIFAKAFRSRETVVELEALLKHKSMMVLETALTPTEEIKSKIVQWVQSNPHPVKYVRDKFQTSRIEDPTMADVTLTFQSEDPKSSEPKAVVCFECKFMSDISHETTHHYARNQIARIMDVGWSVYGNRFYFILVTPGVFKNSKTRLYGYKMRDYQSGDLDMLKQDLLIGGDIPDGDLQLISRKIGWVSWEDLIQTLLQFQGSTAKVPFNELVDFFRERKLLQVD